MSHQFERFFTNCNHTSVLGGSAIYKEPDDVCEEHVHSYCTLCGQIFVTYKEKPEQKTEPERSEKKASIKKQLGLEAVLLITIAEETLKMANDKIEELQAKLKTNDIHILNAHQTILDLRMENQKLKEENVTRIHSVLLASKTADNRKLSVLRVLPTVNGLDIICTE